MELEEKTKGLKGLVIACKEASKSLQNIGVALNRFHEEGNLISNQSKYHK